MAAIAFACPSCGASGSVDESLVGKHVRCKHCAHRFAVPGRGEADAGGYTLAEPTPEPARVTATVPDPGPVFVPARGNEPRAVRTTRKPKRTAPGTSARRDESDFAWRTWLIRGGVLAATAVLATALFVPRGVAIAGSAMILLGMAMVLVGYAAGAYGAFCEDFLYGFFYLVIPLYTAYYLVTRWDDLRGWFALSTAGVGLVLLGTELFRWAGAGG
jgi:predicted Zn finger-like uncharacterized protein